MGARWKLELAKLLAAAGARSEALARLEALDADGVVDRAKPAERAELAELGWRLALATGQPDKAASWDARARALVPGSAPPGAVENGHR
jgi:Tfp pilus assembly protein PilF